MGIIAPFLILTVLVSVGLALATMGIIGLMYQVQHVLTDEARKDRRLLKEIRAGRI